MTLKEIILNEERQKSAISHGWKSWEEVREWHQSIALKEVSIDALEKALDRLDSVMRWAATEGYRLNSRGEWFAPGASGSGTDSQLYDIYKRQNKEKNP